MTQSRFVILHHLAPTGEHWDFMLERESCLLTWQLQSEPTTRDACPIHCVRIKDHRKHYLDYQGPISGGRGMVSRYDRGHYDLLAASDSAWTIRLTGTRLTGDFHLERNDLESRSQWTLFAI